MTTYRIKQNVALLGGLRVEVVEREKAPEREQEDYANQGEDYVSHAHLVEVKLLESRGSFCAGEMVDLYEYEIEAVAE